jgi:hypothetical protein
MGGSVNVVDVDTLSYFVDQTTGFLIDNSICRSFS